MSSSQELNNDMVQCPLNPKHLVRRKKLPSHITMCKKHVQCPLNPNHFFRRNRLEFHLLKCEKSFPDKVRCPYGHFYYSKKHEMANHVQTCPHNPRVAQAEEMQANQPRNENILIAQSVLKDSLRSPHKESRDSLRVPVTVPTDPECMSREYKFGGTQWDDRIY